MAMKASCSGCDTKAKEDNEVTLTEDDIDAQWSRLT